jgi:hypothetical protein
MRSYIGLVGAFAFGMAVFAASTAALTAPADPPTRVEADQAGHAIRFIVDGREEARIDATGLHVRQDVVYGDNITVIGEANYDRPVKPEPKP